MDVPRKNAYRRLLYRATLDIRPLAWTSFSLFRLVNPIARRALLQQIRRAGVLADWLHNLALYSALEFEGFDEAQFWRTFDWCNVHHPDLQVSDYKDDFERELIGSDPVSE